MSRTLDVAAGSAVLWMNSTWSLPMACLSIDLRRLRGESPQILGLPLTIQHYTTVFPDLPSFIDFDLVP